MLELAIRKSLVDVFRLFFEVVDPPILRSRTMRALVVLLSVKVVVWEGWRSSCSQGIGNYVIK